MLGVLVALLLGGCLAASHPPAPGDDSADVDGDAGHGIGTGADGIVAIAYAHVSWSAHEDEMRVALDAGEGSWELTTIDRGGSAAGLLGGAIDGSGNVHLAYGYLAETLSTRYATNRSGEWRLEDIGAADAGSRANLVLDSAGEPAVMFGGGTYGDGRLARRGRTGWTLEPLAFDTDTTAGSSHLFAIDADDALHVVFWDDGDVYYATNRDPAVSGDGVDQDCDGQDG